MFIKHLLKEYLEQAGKLKVSDILWIPFTKIGIHALELDTEVLIKRGPKFIRKVENNVERLKKSKIEAAKVNSITYPEDLHKLIQSWNFNAQMNFSRKLTPVELQHFQDIDDEDFHSVLYDDVLKGRTDKRGLRLHFLDVFFPLTMNCHGTIKSVPIDLKSISKDGMLFRINSSYKHLIESSHSFNISLKFNSLFECWSDQIKLLFTGLKLRDGLLSRPDRNRSNTYTVNMEKVIFSQNRIEKAKAPYGRNQKYYFCIPFDALEDPVLLSEADCGRMFRSQLDNFKNDLDKALLAS